MMVAGAKMRSALSPHMELQQFLDITSELYCVARTDGTLVRLSRSWESVLGYGLEELQGRPWMELVHPDDREQTEQQMRILLQGQRVSDFVNRYVCRDGSLCWLDWHSSLVMEDGLIYAVARNVTVQRQAEEALAQERLLLRTLIDSIPDLVFVKDQHSRYLSCNAAFAQFSGCSEADLAGRTDLALPWAEDAAIYQSNDRLCMAGDQPRRNEEWLPRHDGKKACFDVLKTPFHHPDGRTLGVLGVARDITDLREAEQALHRAVQEWSLVVDSLEDGLCLLDRDHRVVRANRAFWHLTDGCQPGEPFLHCFPCGGRESAGAQECCPICIALRSSQAACLVLEASSPHNPLGFPIQVTIKPLLSVGGRSDGTLIMVQDLSLQREQEKTLHRTIETLSLANLELERLSHIAAHDLQEPARALVSFSQLLEKRYGGLLQGDGVEYLHFITNAARRMQLMIQDVLAYNKTRQNGVALRKVDLDQVAAQVREGMAETLHHFHAVMEVESLGCVLGDVDRLTNLLHHLVSNSLKFQHADRSPHICLRGEVVDGWRLISVTDNGIGIPHEHRRAVFGLFTRLHNHSRIPGTGIGLAVCQRICEDLGGCIWIEDGADGSGITFRIRLRAAE